MKIRPSHQFVFAACIALVACGQSAPPPTDPSAAPPPQQGQGQGGGHGPGNSHGDRKQHAHPDFPACAVLAKACHAHDKESDKAHTCHRLGHSAPSNEECEAKRSECVAVCGGEPK